MRLSDIKTPAYVIDERKLKENLEILKEVQDRSGAKILLAQKAYSVYQTYPLIAEYLDGTTASGIYEQYGRQFSQLLFSPPQAVQQPISKTTAENAANVLSMISPPQKRASII